MSREKKIPTSALSLADMIINSNLLAPDMVRSLLAAFEATSAGASAAAFASFLVAQDALTQWQCSKLCNGQYKGFLLDHYRLDAHVSSDATHSRYAATDMRSQQRVILAFEAGPPPPRYTVEPFGTLNER